MFRKSHLLIVVSAIALSQVSPAHADDEMKALIGGIVGSIVVEGIKEMSQPQEQPEHFGKRFLIQSEHRAVTYLDEDAFSFDMRGIGRVKENNKHDICFTKPKKNLGRVYKLESEYRFCFFVFDLEGNQISVKKGFKDLRIPSLASMSQFSSLRSLFTTKDCSNSG